MAIAKMEKLALTFKAEHLDEVLHLMQGFQGVHIEAGFESSIPPAKKAEVDKEIRETEKNLQEIHAAYSVIKGRESANMLSALKNSEEKKLSIAELIKTVEESDWEKILDEIIQTDRRLQNNRTRRQEVTGLLGELRIWEHLGCNPLDLRKLHRTTAAFGSVHEKHADEFAEVLAEHGEDGIYFERITSGGDRVYFLLMYHNSLVDRVSIFINEFSFSAEEYRFDKPPAEAAADLEKEEIELLRAEKEIDALLIEQSKYKQILLFAEDYNLNALLRKKKSLEVTYNGSDIEIDGWIVSEKRGQFMRLLSERLRDGDYQVSVRPIKDRDIGDVPIKLKNGRVAAIFERLIELYGMPRYNEIDPTPVMTIFYMIFFGMMVADVGYGAAIFLVGLVVKKWLRVRRSTRGFVDFLWYLSFPIMGWGIVYGSFFGLRLPFGGWIPVTVDIIPMTVISIVLGYFHIMAGLVLQMINQTKLRRHYDLLTGGMAWFLTFLGGGVMILANFVLSGFLSWAGAGALFRAAAVVLGIGLSMTLLVPAIQYGRRWYAGIGKGLYAFYGAASYLGDFVSFTRLMALGVAGGSVALAFNTILTFLPLPLRLTLGIILAVVLHALNIVLTMLSAYVHGIRLQFIEFFGKFYTGGGRKFEPFKAAEKNVIIDE